MEFVNGRDLAAYVTQEGPLPLPRAIDFMLQAARGLAYAHSQDIIHRDVKPHNLLVSEQGVVKVTDLGLARLQHEADGSVARSDVTAAGVIVGTADFMPPEQAFDPDAIDSRADIYSLGCTLYYLLAGKPPLHRIVGLRDSNVSSRRRDPLLGRDLPRHTRSTGNPIPTHARQTAGRSNCADVGSRERIGGDCSRDGHRPFGHVKHRLGRSLKSPGGVVGIGGACQHDDHGI